MGGNAKTTELLKECIDKVIGHKANLKNKRS